jgi:amino acid transporter
MQPSKEYVPGTCNIGPKEMKKRKVASVISLMLTIVTIVLLLFSHADKTWRLLLFIPLAALIVNLQQWYFHFCVNFGMRGVFNFDNPGKLDTVEQAEFRRKDRNKAIQMIAVGIFFGLVGALLFYFLPV